MRRGLRISRRLLGLAILVLILLPTFSILTNQDWISIPTAKADPDWLTGWEYRKQHNITGSSAGAQTDYQIPLTVWYGDIDGEIYFTDNGVDEPLYTAGYPRSVYYNGVTYMVWQGESGYDPYICTYDHTTDVFSIPVKVGTNPLTNDYHGAPSIVIDENGYIHVFFGAHTYGASHTNLKYSKSDNPEDISAWTAQDDPTTEATYPNVLTDGAGNIHLTYRRHIGYYGDYAYRLSDDNGATWGAASVMVELEDEGDYDAIYHYMPQLVGNKLHIVWRYFDSSDPNDIFHAYRNLTDSQMYNVSGTNLGDNITYAESIASCRIVDSGALGTSHMAQHIDEDGYPYIIYGINTTVSGINYMFVKWNSTHWSTPQVITSSDSMSNNMEFIINSPTSITAFLIGNGSAGRGGDIDKWSWDGTDWSKVKTILSEATAEMPLVSPKIPIDYDPEITFIFTEFGGIGVGDLKVYASDGDDIVYDRDNVNEVSAHEHCRTDFGDIRFTNSSGDDLLDYWMEELNSSNYAYFWVEIPAIPESPAVATIYIYYGKADATNVSSGVDTAFDGIFDDFESYNVDDPIPTGGMWDTNDAVCKDDPDAEGYNKTAYLTATGATGELLTDVFTNQHPVAVRFDIRRTSNVVRDGYIYIWDDATIVTTAYWNSGDHEYYDGTYKDFSPVLTSTLQTWEQWEYRIYSDFHVMNDGVDHDGAFRNAIDTGISKIAFRSGATGVTGAWYYDNFWIRKFADPEPTNHAWGLEEELRVTVTTTINSTEYTTTTLTTDVTTQTQVLQTIWTVVLVIVDPLTTITQTSITQCVTSTNTTYSTTYTNTTDTECTTTTDTTVQESTTTTDTTVQEILTTTLKTYNCTLTTTIKTENSTLTTTITTRSVCMTTTNTTVSLCVTTTGTSITTYGTTTTTTGVGATAVIDGCVLDEFGDDALVAWYNNTHRHDSAVDILEDPEVHTPDDILNVTGVTDDGNLASVQTFDDSDTYNVSEVVGNPGFNILINFTDLTDMYTDVHCSFYVWYDGGAGHDVLIQAWNFTSGAWINCGIITEAADFGWFNVSHIGVGGDIIQDGNLTIRIYHDDAGNINHDFYIDYIELNLDVCPCGQVWSTNMLVGLNVTSIVYFRYDITIPTAGEATARVQFSQDNSTWVRSDGQERWDDMTDGDNTILLTGLNWAGNFYYRVWLVKDVNGTSPVLDLAQVCYSVTAAGGGSWNFIIVITVLFALLGAGIIMRSRRR